jgi:hypothetical protein
LNLQQPGQHFLHARRARGLQLPLDSGFQGCITNFDIHR